LEELPPLSEIKDLDKFNEELALSDMPPERDTREGGESENTRGSEEEPERLFYPLDDEPELDESTLMSMDKVDAVNSGFETEFRRKAALEAENDAAPAIPVAAELKAAESDSADSAANKVESSPHE